jgi:hypothetical protein
MISQLHMYLNNNATDVLKFVIIYQETKITKLSEHISCDCGWPIRIHANWISESVGMKHIYSAIYLTTYDI